MFCFHKWSKVEDRYQTCQKCGKTRVVSCAHKWKIINTSNILYYDDGRKKIIGYIFTMQCSHCGEIKSKKEYIN